MSKKQLDVRLPMNRYVRLKSAAHKNHISMTRAVSDLIGSSNDLPNDKIHRLRVLDLTDVNSLNRCYEELRRIGNNINQISHKLNINPTVNVKGQFSLVLQDFWAVHDELVEEMKLRHDY